MIFTTLTLIYNSLYYAITFLLTFFMYLHSVLPFGLDVGILGVAAYFYTKLPKPDSSNVYSIFGPEAGSRESENYPDRTIKCIAHRGAGLDAPENTLQAFKYVSIIIIHPLKSAKDETYFRKRLVSYQFTLFGCILHLLFFISTF